MGANMFVSVHVLSRGWWNAAGCSELKRQIKFFSFSYNLKSLTTARLTQGWGVPDLHTALRNNMAFSHGLYLGWLNFRVFLAASVYKEVHVSVLVGWQQNSDGATPDRIDLWAPTSRGKVALTQPSLFWKLSQKMVCFVTWFHLFFHSCVAFASDRKIKIENRGRTQIILKPTKTV